MIDLRSQAAHVNSLPLAPAPFSQGLTAADYAAQHEQHGETFRYWYGIKLPDATADSNKDGLIYVEQTLGGNKMARFWNGEDKATQKAYGVVPMGTLMMSVLPAVAEIQMHTMILRTAPKQVYPLTAIIRRGTTDTDPLPQAFVSSIDRVTLSDGSAVAASHYTAISANTPNDSDRGGIKWLSGAPSVGALYTVSLHYYQLFSCWWDSYRNAPIGADGERLPQRVLLKKERE